MAAPAYGGVQGAGTGSGTSRVMNAPAGRSPLDPIVYSLYVFDPATAIPTPAGVSPIPPSPTVDLPGNDTFQIRSYLRLATGDANDNITFSWTGSAFNGGGCIYLTGAHQSNPLDSSSVDASGLNSALAIPTWDTSVAETLKVVVWATQDASALTPSGFTQRLSGNGVAIGTGAGPVGAGAVGATTGTFAATESWAAHAFAIAPPTPAPTPKSLAIPRAPARGLVLR
jgi:hypothetical protein